MNITLSPAPWDIGRAAAIVLWRDGVRMAITSIVFSVLPYLAGYMFIYLPTVDGSQDYSGITDPMYLGRYYGFILWFFVVRGINLVTTGQLIYDGFAGRHTSLADLVPRAAPKLARALPLYLVVVTAIYIGQYLWLIPAIFVGFFALFFLIPYVIEGRKFGDAWQQAALARRGHHLALATAYLLLFGLLWAVQKSQGLLVGALPPDFPSWPAPALIAIVFSLSELVSHAVMTAMYFSTRPHFGKPDQATAALFD